MKVVFADGTIGRLEQLYRVTDMRQSSSKRFKTEQNDMSFVLSERIERADDPEQIFDEVFQE